MAQSRTAGTDTHEAIMRGALDEFAAHTFAGARIQEIASRAGVALGTIYNYFEHKEALGNAVYRRWKTETRRYGVWLVEGRSPEDTFAVWWGQMAAFFGDHPAAFLFLETQHHSPYLDAESRALASSIDAAAVRSFIGWQQSGAARPGEPEVLISMVVGLFRSLVTELAKTGRTAGPEELEWGRDCAWTMVQRPPQGRKR